MAIFLSLNDVPLELGVKVAWISRARQSEPEICSGELFKITQRKQTIRWGPRKGESNVYNTFSIYADKGYLKVGCRNPSRIVVLTGLYDKDTESLAKLTEIMEKGKPKKQTT
jgi:hypothetical protein